MTEHDLEKLKDLPVPPASPEARARALKAARAAFEKEPATPTQAEPSPLRQTRLSDSKRRLSMNFSSRQFQALAASLLALVVAAPIAFKQFQARDAAAPPMELAKAEPEAAPAPAPNDAPSLQERRDAVVKSEEKAKADGALAGAEPSKQSSTVVDGLLANAPPMPSPQVAPAAQPSALPYSNDVRQSLGAGALVDSGRAKDAARKSAVAAAAVAPSSMMERDRLDQKPPVAQSDEEFRDKFAAKDINPVKQVATEPVSTFSIDVDTASYSFVRRALMEGRLPPKDAVRVEEMINYFPYAYPAPETSEEPFKPTVTVMPSPWNPANKLVHVAIKGYDLKSTERPRANLVFLMDVSGSMDGPDRLPLVKNAFRLLLDELKPDDTVGIVTYAGDSGIALEPTKVSDKAKILAAIDALGAGGSTAGADGIKDAYRLAEANFNSSAVNRIILATDGDFNVGITDESELKGLIERKRKTGVYLSILGVGRGNFNDALMQTLAQNGNGTAAYVDTLNEARKVLVDEASSTLFPIAKDVKIQIEFNPARIAEYRLIGYETRALKREDFNNDRVDAGDIGSGHTVTAIYEVTPVGSPHLVDDLRYAKKLAAGAPATTRGDATSDPSTSNAARPADGATEAELGFLKLRYKRPSEDASRLISVPITEALQTSAVDGAPPDVRFSVAVSAFGQMLRAAPYTRDFTYDDVLSLAEKARGDDRFGYRSEFLNLVRLAKAARP